MKIAIIGTAGRDKTKPMTLELWEWMLEHAKLNVPKSANLVSGGAAWADHLAVALFLEGHVKELTLHFPAPFLLDQCKFKGPTGSAASAANYYHSQFSKIIGANTLAEIAKAVGTEGVSTTFEPDAVGYGGMFARNLKVAQSGGLLAYTFGRGDVPADGGTKHTWDKCVGKKYHVPLPQ